MVGETIHAETGMENLLDDMPNTNGTQTGLTKAKATIGTIHTPLSRPITVSAQVRPATRAVPGFGAIDWGNIVNQGATAGFQILKDVYGGVRPGVYQQTKDGVTYRLPEGSTNVGFTSLPTFDMNNSTWLIIGGAALVLVLLVSKR